MRGLVATLAILCCGGGPGDAAALAAADLARQPAAARRHLRYLSLYAVPERQRAEWVRVLAFHANSLSREAELTPPALVAPDLLRVSLPDYGWDPKVWDRLAKVDPHFHATVVTEKVSEEQRYHPGGEVNGTYYAPGNYTFRTREKVKALAAAPWLPAKAAAYLAAETRSEAPLLRGDWFLYQTAIQKDRVAGYYDFLGLGKSQKDFERLVGADEAAAKRVKREIKAIVARSSVTLQNRVINRYGAITGGYWITYDYKESTAKRNALRFLDKDIDPADGDAAESYGVLPNGLFAFFLADGAGVRQDTAPDFIASDGRANGTDRRVHVGMSCVRCHVEGIRPINDWMRQVYRSPVALAAVDKDQFVRFRQLYLSDLARWVRRDSEDYAETLARLTGQTAAQTAAAYGRAWESYAEADLLPADVARETGYPAETVVAALRAYATPGKGVPPLDPVLAGLIADPPVAVRREHFDEVFPLLMQILLGYKP